MNRFETPGFSGLKKSAVLFWASLGALFIALTLTVACSPKKKAGQSNNSPQAGQQCENIYDGTSCQNASNCQWTGASCSGNATYCAKFTSSGNCPLACQWNTTTYTCQPLSQQSTVAPCSTFSTQQMCSQYNGCVWNGYNCITSSGTTTGTPYPTTGNPYPTTGNPYPTTGNPYPTTGGTDPTTGSPSPTTGQAPVAFCATLDTLQCVITKGCRLALFPNFGCIPKQ